jgi:hypothetical protein
MTESMYFVLLFKQEINCFRFKLMYYITYYYFNSLFHTLKYNFTIKLKSFAIYFS